jgi:transposase InsO family protein
MSERLNFINDWLTRRGSVAGLCSVYGISSKTGNKWIARFKANGKSGLEDISRACLTHPNATDAATTALVIAARHAHPSWGPHKLRDWLIQRHPGQPLPASSTMGDILKHAGLVKPRRRGRRLHGGQGSTADYDGPNSVWCIDYKGQFRLGDGNVCYPLTITDGHSRMVLCCEGHPGPRDADARSSMEAVFKHYGLPAAIRSDNGTPFASIGAGRLTALSVWWQKLGIGLQRISPGKPQENGRHERMHRTLKAETASPPARDSRRQQDRFDRWVEEFNFERPHQALDGDTPASVHVLSEREYPGEVGDPEYPGHHETRRVGSNGFLKFRMVKVYLSQALSKELVGLVEVDDGEWRVRFAGVELATYDERTKEMKQTGGSARASSKGKKYKHRVSPMRPV